MFRRSKEDVVRNLKDAGCSQQTIEQFMECLKRGTLSEQMELLSRHRQLAGSDAQRTETD